MNTLFSQFVSVVLRLLVLSAGLVFAAGVAVLAAALGSLLLLRSGWNKLAARTSLRSRMASRSPQAPPMRGGASISRRPRGEVTDVVAREPS